MKMFFMLLAISQVAFATNSCSDILEDINYETKINEEKIIGLERGLTNKGQFETTNEYQSRIQSRRNKISALTSESIGKINNMISLNKGYCHYNFTLNTQQSKYNADNRSFDKLIFESTGSVDFSIGDLEKKDSQPRDYNLYRPTGILFFDSAFPLNDDTKYININKSINIKFNDIDLISIKKNLYYTIALWRSYSYGSADVNGQIELKYQLELRDIKTRIDVARTVIESGSIAKVLFKIGKVDNKTISQYRKPSSLFGSSREDANIPGKVRVALVELEPVSITWNPF